MVCRRASSRRHYTYMCGMQACVIKATLYIYMWYEGVHHQGDTIHIYVVCRRASSRRHYTYICGMQACVIKATLYICGMQACVIKATLREH